jgi:hypothetical protein
MKTQMKVCVNLEVTVTSCSYLTGYKTKAHATVAKQGFKSIEACQAFSDEFGVHTTYYKAHVFFLGQDIASSDEHKTEEKAIKQAYKLAKEYLEQL